MKLCFPVEKFDGVQSNVFGHFGSAPSFVLVDTETGEATDLANQDAGHSHGKCNPLKALGGQTVDAVIVGGIGGGALSKLNALGVSVYKAEGGTVSHNISLFNEGRLSKFNPGLVCGGHSIGGGCAHH